MRSFFCTAIPEAGAEAVIGGEEAFHAVRVLRMREGGRLRLLDGHGGRAEAEIVRLERRGRSEDAVVRVLRAERWEPPRVRLHLLVAPPRASSARARSPVRLQTSAPWPRPRRAWS